MEKDLKLKDEIIEEQLVYASTQEDYYQYKIKYNQLRNIFDNKHLTDAVISSEKINVFFILPPKNETGFGLRHKSE